jgi:hypothetical protein
MHPADQEAEIRQLEESNIGMPEAECFWNTPQQAKRPWSGKTKSSVHLFVFPVVLSLGPV